ncbi:MAG TPA: hypothetical protein VMT46_17430 [Anaerolineaceae bacterium]|nr:hypothetical protein [Anaerolineaceae bacterium]
MQLKKRGEATQEEMGCDYSVTARQPQERDTNTREKSKAANSNEECSKKRAEFYANVTFVQLEGKVL